MNQSKTAKLIENELQGEAVKTAPEPLVEAKLSRVLAQIEKDEFVLISASHKDYTPEEQEKKLSELKADIKALDLGFIPVEGHGEEEDSQGNRGTVVEKTLLVPNGDQGRGKCRGFRNAMIGLGQKYNQTAIIWGYGGKAELIEGDKVVARFDNFKAGAAQYFTRIRTPKSYSGKKDSGRYTDRSSSDFRLESLKKAPGVPGIWDGMARQAQGELEVYIENEVRLATEKRLGFKE